MGDVAEIVPLSLLSFELAQNKFGLAVVELEFSPDFSGFFLADFAGI